MDRAFFAHLSSVARAAIAAEMAAGLRADNKDAAGFDPVTEADRAAERALRAAIEAAFPDHGIWGEEYGATRAATRRSAGASTRSTGRAPWCAGCRAGRCWSG